MQARIHDEANQVIAVDKVSLRLFGESQKMDEKSIQMGFMAMPNPLILIHLMNICTLQVAEIGCSMHCTENFTFNHLKNPMM